MVIFHCYVSLPKGISYQSLSRSGSSFLTLTDPAPLSCLRSSVLDKVCSSAARRRAAAAESPKAAWRWKFLTSIGNYLYISIYNSFWPRPKFGPLDLYIILATKMYVYLMDVDGTICHEYPCILFQETVEWCWVHIYIYIFLPCRSFDLQILRCGRFGWFHLDLLVQREAIPHSVPVHP